MYDERIAKLKKQQNESSQKAGSTGSGSMYDERIAQWKKSQNQGGTKNTNTNSAVQIGNPKTYEQHLNESREARIAEQQAFYAKHGDNAYLMEYDLEAGRKEIDALKEKLGKLRIERNAETARNVADNAHLGMPYAANQQASAISERDKLISELEKQLASMQQLYNKAKYYQYGQELASAADNEDFAQYSGYVKSDNDLYEWLNNPEFREQYEAAYQYAPNPGARKSAYKRKGYDQLTDKELSLYNYYYATEGEEKAQEYLYSIAETLNYRAGAEIASGISGKTGLEIAYGAAAGLSQFDSGIRGVASMITGKDDYIPVSRQQAAGEAVRKNLSDNGKKLPTWLGGASMGQVGYDILSTTANMAPSILASAAVGLVNPTAGAYLGSGLMGVSAAGNAYQTALNEGYDKSSARFYATAIGVSETLMQSLLGGVSQLGGVSPAVTKAVSGIDNGLLRFAAQYGASMAAEGIEEGLQEVLDPILQQAILNADDASVNWSDVAYSALLGAMSAGTLEVGTNVRQSIQESEAKKRWTGRTDELIAEGLSYDAGTKANEIAKQYKAQVDSGKSMTGAQIKNQLEANEVQRVETAARKRLVELGETDDPAEIAKIATKRAMGEALKPAEKSRLARSKFGAQVAKELVPDKVANGKTVDAMTRPGKYKPLDTRVGKDVSGRVSESGKNELADSGAEFDLKQIDAKTGNDGKLVWTVDGQEATSENIKLKDEDTAYIFEAVEQIENITPTAAPVLVRSVDTRKNVIKQLNGLDEAYTYGYNGYTEADMNAGEFTSDLTDTQKMDAFRLGEAARKSRTETRAQSIKKMRTAAEAEAAQGKSAQLKITYDHGNGNVEDFRSNKVKGLTDKQRAAIKVAEMLHKLGVGTDIEFFSSYLSKTLKDPKTGKAARVFLDENGNEVAAYAGVYMGAGGKIRIDLNAYNGRRLALNAMSHELVHFVQDWSPEKYQAMAEFLASAYGETELSMHQRVLREQERLQRTRNQDVPYAEAYNEVVANALNKMFDDGTIMTKLAELRNKDAALADKIIEGIRIIADRLLSVFNQNQYLYHDTLDLMQMGDTFKQIQDMFAEALVDASDNLQAARIAQEAFGDSANIETNENGELLLATNENKSVVMYSEQTYLNGGRDKLETALRQNGHTETEITETLSYVDDALDYIKVLAAGYAKQMGYNNLSDHLIADVITNVKTGKQVMSSIVNNGDYPVNIDLSLICKKRVAYMNLMSRLIRDGVFDKVNYDGAAIAEVNGILRENGFETACLGCFVESRRLQFQTWAETIVSEWNAEVEKRNPNADNFGFAKGDMKSLIDSDINALTRELESVKKNDQGNVNLGQGNSVTRMGRLLDALPSLQKKLTVEDLLTPEGLTALRQHDGSLFSIVKSRYGAASPKIVQDFNPYASEIAMLSFAQVKNITSNAVKGAQTYVKEVKSEYGKIVRANGESKENFNKRKKLHEQRIQDEAMRRYLYDIGGARIQSFSDFMIENVFDYIQIFADLAAKRLPLHGYTKEIVCMRLFGMTGAKWNGSLIAHVERDMGKELAGLLPADTKDGIPVKVDGKDYVIGFDDYARNAATKGKSFIQSIGMKDILALQLDPRYSPYVGNITIGVSDAQIMAMLDSPLFRMVIPYHASGMLPMFAKLVGVDMYNDYTDYQNTTVRQYYDLNGNAVSELKNTKGDAVKADTSYAFNAEIQKTKDAKTAANNYLKWCAQRHPVYDGKTLVGYATFNPKFSSSPYGTDFTRHENYYKLLEDFNTYDSVTEESAVQGAVTMNFPSEENRLNEQQMAEYKNALRQTGVFTEQDIEKYSKKADMTFKEIINAEVGNRANYAATQAPKWESTVKEVEAKLQKDYSRNQYSSQETDFDSDFDYSELNWARDLGIITAKDQAIFERTINNEILRGAKPQSANGEYIIDTGRCLMFTDGDFHSPTLSRIIEFATDYESLTADAKEMIFDEAKATGEVQTAIKTIEKMFGPGFVSLRNQPIGRSYGRQARGRKGSNRSGTSQKARSLKERLDEDGLSYLLEDDAEQYSTQETDNISNRHLLANAFEGVSRSSDEYGMIQDYKRNIDKLNKLEEQLSDVNAEIWQLRFGKDIERDPERLKALEEKADGLAKEINKYDKRLINMEASEPLRKVLDRERKKVRQKTIEHTKQIQKNRKNRKEQIEIKKKIRRVIRDLDKLFNRGDKKRNVKDGLRDFVEYAIKATDVLFMENVSKYDVLRNGFSATLTPDEKLLVEEAHVLLDKLDRAYADSNEQNPYSNPAFVEAERVLDAKLAELESVFERDRIARGEKSVSEVIGKIKSEYKKLERSDQFVARSAYSDAVYDHMTQLADSIGDTKVKDMTTEQLKNLHEMYNWVKATVTMANKFFSENMKKSVEETAKQSVQEFNAAEANRKRSKTAEKVYAALDAVGWNNEKVIYALRRLNNSAITTLMQNIIDGEDVTMRDVQEAIKFRRETEKKYNVKKWDLDEVHTFEDKVGNKFEMTLAQMLSFYAYSRRDAARQHMTRGGIVIKPATLLKKGTAESYTVSEFEIAKIENALTQEQRDYVVAMQTYLSDVMGAKGNEVSLKLHGIKMFNEESYFPIRSAEQYMGKAKEADLKNQIGITNMASAGFTQSLVKEASNAIEIGDFLYTWANHVNEMSRYHGFVLPMEDFRKVFNYSKTASGDESGSTAVRASMENAFGKGAVKYFDDLYRDLNSSAATDRESEKAYRKMFSRFKKGAVMYSLSVVVQQPTAIVRAGAMIDRKYFGVFGSPGRIATGIARIFTKNHAKLWDEMMTYAPGVAMIKDIGGFDTATGGSVLQALMEDSYEGIKENFEAFKKHPLEYIAKKADDNFLSKIPAYADQIAWVEIWNAVKRETLSKNKDMVANSQVHLEASGKRFSEVIRATQVYDSVFAKSPQMRSKSLAMQMLTSFMSEPNTTINMVEDGIREFVRGNKNFGTRELYTVAAAITFNNLIKAVVYAMRADDEDKNFEEKYLAAVIDGLLNDFNPLTYFAGARDVWSVMRGYDIERADMTLISDVVENLSRVKNLSDKDTSEMTEEQLADHEKKQSDAWWALADSISAIVGFPIKNIRRDVKGFVNTVFGERIGSSTKNSIAYVVEEALEDAKPQMFRGTTQSKTDRLYEVYVSGDKEYLNRIKSQYEDEDAFDKALRKALRENDSRIHEAAMALYKNDAAGYSKQFNAILKEGNFSAHDIREAIDSELSKIKSDSSGETSASTYNTSDFVKSIIVGDNASAKEIRKEYIANKTSAGMTKEDAEKAFQESVNGNVRDSFKSNLLKKDMAKKIMTKYGGKSEEEVDDKLTCWEFQMEYPDVDISDNAILDYYDIAKPLGIKLSSYLTFVNGKKGAKKDQVVTTIHKLPLTQKQKDALYLIAGYAESGLWNTPWHR